MHFVQEFSGMNQKRESLRVTHACVSYFLLLPKNVKQGKHLLPGSRENTFRQKPNMGNQLPKLIAISGSLTIGITLGIQTPHVEDRPELGWLVGIISTVVLGSLMFTLLSESHCGWMRCVGRGN